MSQLDSKDSFRDLQTNCPQLNQASSAPHRSALHEQVSVASSSGRRFPSDTTAIAGWLPSPAGAGRGDDLSLGFNAGGAVSASSGAAASLAAGLWGSRQAAAAAAAAALGYGAIGAAGDVGMLVVAPAGSFHHHQQQQRDDHVLPLITAAQRTLVDPDAAASGNAKPPVSSAGAAIQFWHQESPADGSPGGKKALAMLDHGRGGSGSGVATCQDCGNQAKKGCPHSRCRTCCNSRGFDCDTHVRSTWVPAARRRERLQLAGAAGASPPPTPVAPKKPRLACLTPTATTTNSRASTSNATTPRSFDTSSSHQDASFKDSLPRQVRGPAVFRCVRVTSVDDSGLGVGGNGNGEVAYQAAVTINGHLFRGLLYDHGAEADGRAAVMPAASDLNLSSAAAPNLYSGGSAPLILGGLGYGHTP